MEHKNIPHTCAAAKVTKFKQVSDVYAIEVKNARYRGAEFSGVVALEDGSDSLQHFRGKFRAKVSLDWFGTQLKKHSRYITLDAGQFNLMPVYSGAVVANLG